MRLCQRRELPHAASVEAITSDALRTRQIATENDVEPMRTVPDATPYGAAMRSPMTAIAMNSEFAVVKSTAAVYPVAPLLGGW